MVSSICIIGAGTMGIGIAQVAAQNGIQTMLFDLDKAALEKAGTGIQKDLQYLVDKEKISAEESRQSFKRIQFSSNINDCVADVIIEAIIENMEAKTALFDQLASMNSPATIFASNTSSLSISAIQTNILHPQRVVGMHFFNPAPLMKLVEIVAGNKTSDKTMKAVGELCEQMKKIPVVCNDAPGFIVNRVARHYYLEAMKLVEQGIAGIEDIDRIMEASGFKMGPFRLMDLIGMDVNLAVSQSIYDAFDHEKRFAPSAIQIDKVAKKELGRKSGKGFYQY